jgi:hypothetical protein
MGKHLLAYSLSRDLMDNSSAYSLSEDLMEGFVVVV